MPELELEDPRLTKQRRLVEPLPESLIRNPVPLPDSAPDSAPLLTPSGGVSYSRASIERSLGSLNGNCKRDGASTPRLSPSNLVTEDASSDSPIRPNRSALRARRRTLFGAQLSGTSAGNAFLDLYSGDGAHFTLRSLADFERVAGHLASLPLHFLGDEIMRTPSTSQLNPGPDDVQACSFTRLCCRNSDSYNTAFANDRALREMSTVPLFKSPKVLMILVKNEEPRGDGGVYQAWFPWQMCTNCIAGRAVGRCSLFVAALEEQTPLRVLSVAPGQASEDDDCYGWFTDDSRDAFLNKDLGFFELWLCRDDQHRHLADP
ncbi:hypothetical protein BCR34DRAFT_604530 [Clohesyomyces aquaticus]|uniref:Uncharacterized protein n=1 Tax=Clohesyomyces aquaticus TaxID=1231657 RepID=A0A1Y1Z673_9PLEO|nr:hypothetical protein BCR34DRAFT_604530 [Clohesyomyces aquaticus]